MNIGTKSVLYGAHQFILHPLFLARAWYRLHGFRRVKIGWRLRPGGPDRHYIPSRVTEYASLFRPALWIAFIVHDLGYFGKPNMDGAEGERHPELGAGIMRRLFGEPWGEFTLLHSRFYAKQQNRQHSALCVADKLATVITPRWLYMALVRATGEISEYMAMSARNNATGDKYAFANISSDNEAEWYRDMSDYTRRWVEEHKDGRADTWTPAPAQQGAA